MELNDRALLELWSGQFHFSLMGRYDDAVEYIGRVLAAIGATDKAPSTYNREIGHIDGQQQFMFQWLIAQQLITLSGKDFILTSLGSALLQAIEEGRLIDVLERSIDIT